MYIAIKMILKLNQLFIRSIYIFKSYFNKLLFNRSYNGFKPYFSGSIILYVF